MVLAVISILLFALSFRMFTGLFRRRTYCAAANGTCLSANRPAHGMNLMSSQWGTCGGQPVSSNSGAQPTADRNSGPAASESVAGVLVHQPGGRRRTHLLLDAALHHWAENRLETRRSGAVGSLLAAVHRTLGADSPGRDAGGRLLPDPVVIPAEAAGAPPMPASLKGAGRAEWHRLWTAGRSWLSPDVDLMVMTRRCENHDLRIDMLAHIERDRLTVAGDKGQPRPHPVLAGVRALARRRNGPRTCVW